MLRYTVLFLFVSFAFYAQSKVHISGKVLSSEGIGIEGVAIMNDQMTRAKSDSLGFFRFDVANRSIEMFTLKHPDYIDEELVFRNLKKDSTLTVTLKKKALELKEVLITSNKKQSFQVLSGGKIGFQLKDLASLPTISGTTDIIKLLQLTPGVQNSGDANGYLYVRGGDPGHNAILYAGTPVYGMAHLLGVFPFYNSDHVTGVEFDKSSSNAKHGGRLSATTLLKTNYEIPTMIGIQGNVGLLSSQITMAIPVTKKLGFYISGRKTYIDEIVVPVINFTTKANNPQDFKYGFTDGNFTLINNFNAKNSLVMDAFVSSDKLQINDAKINFKSSLKWQNLTFSPKITSQLSKKLSLVNAGYFTQYSTKFEAEQAGVTMNVLSRIKTLGLTSYINSTQKDFFTSMGFDFVSHIVAPQTINTNNAVNTISGNSDNRTKASEFTCFGTTKTKLFKMIALELGFRVNYYTSGSKKDTYIKFEPRTLLNFQPNNKMSFYASYARQNQYLNLITTSSVGIPSDFWIASTDGIKPQSSHEFALGYKNTLFTDNTLTFGGYYRLMKDLLEYPYAAAQFNEISTFKKDLVVGKGNSYGFELLLQTNKTKFKGWMSYTLSWSTRNFDAINNGNTYFAKYDRRHNLSLVGMYDFNAKWNFGLTQTFSSGNRFTLPSSYYFINNNPVKEYSEYNNATLPNYIRTDISANYCFIKTAKKESILSFSVFNTFNLINPIYVVLNTEADSKKDTGIAKPEQKYLYRILPSISWRFKF